METLRSAAKNVIKILDRRGGFDAWWDEVAEEDRKKILADIEEAISETWDP